MTTMAEGSERVTGGVDTHKYVHVAAALDGRGGLLGVKEFPATAAGYGALHGWLSSFGPVGAVGVEGTGSWGAGLSRWLLDVGVEVFEVGRPNRQRRRRVGKSDPADAEAAARAVLAGDGLAVPKDRSGPVEAARLVRISRQSTTRDLNVVANQLHAVIDSTSTESLRERYRGKKVAQIAREAAATRPRGPITDPDVAAAVTLKRLARRWLELTGLLADIDRDLAAIVALAAPPQLLEQPGVGPEVASTLLVSLGDNPERMRSEAAAAAAWGASPVDASSGLHQRFRLNRGGDRQANRALYIVVLARLRHDPDTQAYMARRLAEGKTRKEVIRILKRYVARQLWTILTQPRALDAP